MDGGFTGELLESARAAGAFSAGIAGVEPFDRERNALLRAREMGRQGPLHFTYQDPELATDVTISFPWARSIVVVAAGYADRAHAPASRGASVARFATSDHYDRVRTATAAVADALESSGFKTATLIDDNRLVDRGAAVRAGIAWPGKSTMVLAPGIGPWMLLGSVVTDAVLEPSRPMRRDCGTCIACMPACPTGAIDGIGLDARRCLSTWLQASGWMPRWIRPLVGRRIYGCDDCLTSCPPGSRPLFAGTSPPEEYPFAELLAESDEELVERFHWWYIPMRQGRYIRRNLLIAAGNSGEPGAREAIEGHLDHRSSMIRGHAAWALARGFGTAALDSLRAAHESETVPEARVELLLALTMITSPETHDALLALDELS